jgi:hypothetical protein
MTVDTVTLTSVINRCFELSTDGELSGARRGKFLAHGKRLRGHLMNLLSAQFDEDTDAVVEANKKLKEVNRELKDSATALERAATTLNDIAQLVGSLDKLLNVAVSFL